MPASTAFGADRLFPDRFAEDFFSGLRDPFAMTNLPAAVMQI
jgi:hypothetical protein